MTLLLEAMEKSGASGGTGTPLPPSETPAHTGRRSGASLWLLPRWVHLCIGGFILTVIGLGGYLLFSSLQKQVDTRVAAAASTTRQLYAADIQAGRQTLSEAYQLSNQRLAAVEQDLEKIRHTQQEVAQALDGFLHNAVSPGALKKVADDNTALRKSFDQLTKAQTDQAKDITLVSSNLRQLGGYVSSQLYPAITVLQGQVHQLATPIKTAPPPSQNLPVGIYLPDAVATPAAAGSQ